MASEAALGAIRVCSNYARQVLSLAANLVLVAVLVSWLGSEGFGLTVLISAAVGLAAMVEEVMRGSLIRELGSAYHGGCEAHFARVYNSAWVLSGIAAVLGGATFALLMVCLAVFNIPEHLLSAARLMVACEGALTVAMILLAPASNMLRVCERFVIDNLLVLGRRVAQLVAAIVLFKVVQITEVSTGLKAFYIAHTAFGGVVVLVGASLILFSSPMFKPAPWRATRGTLAEILKTFSWNSGVIVAMNLYERTASVLMNLLFGLFGNTVFGLALILTSHVRMLSVGVNSGLDAAATRVAHGRSDVSLAAFARSYTMLHALTSIPGAVLLFVLGRPLVDLWIGSRVEDPARMLPLVAALTLILLVPVLARSISDCWVQILYGAGYVRRFAPALLVGGIVHPLTGLGLYLMLPDNMKFYAPAVAYAVVFTAFHMVVLPAVGASLLGLRMRDLISPILRPLLLSVIGAPTLFLGQWWFAEWTALRLLTVVGAFCAVYVGLFVATAGPAERSLLWGPLRRARGFRQGAGADGEGRTRVRHLPEIVGATPCPHAGGWPGDVPTHARHMHKECP
jgi:O-antigen/teichoic acid export membrane protein